MRCTPTSLRAGCLKHPPGLNNQPAFTRRFQRAVGDFGVSRKHMWGPLQHSRHVQFYEEFHLGRQSPDQDWMPMVRAVLHLQTLDFAPSLFAFTSLWRFHVTTSPKLR